jgi:DNA polymerase delta subunit 1
MSITHCFRPYSWNVQETHVIKSRGLPNEYEDEEIHIWGIDKDSNRVMVRIEDFKPFYYIDLGTDGTWKDYMIDELMERIEKKIPILSYKVIHCATLNSGLRKKKLIKVTLSNHMAGRDLYYKLRKDINGYSGVYVNNKKRYLDVLIYDISSVRKLLSLKKIRYCDWINIKGKKINDDDKISTSHLEFKISWKDIEKVDEEKSIEWSTAPIIFSFDIETYNSMYKERPSKFPDKNKAEDVVNIISCVVKTYKKDDRKKYAIVLGESFSDIGMKHENSEIICVKTEKEMEIVMGKLIEKHDPDIVTGYNIHNYDFDYLFARLENDNRWFYPCSRLNSTHPSEMRKKEGGMKRLFHPKWEGRLFIDMLFVAKAIWPNEESHKLDHIAEIALKDNKIPMPPEEMFASYDGALRESIRCYSSMVENSEWKEEWAKEKKKYPIHLKDKVESIYDTLSDESKESYDLYKKAAQRYHNFVDYCLQDSVLVEKIFDFVSEWDSLMENGSIQACNPEDCVNEGVETKSISNLYNKCFEKGIIMDKCNIYKDYEPTGGYVFKPFRGLWDNVCILDFNSLYPNIVIGLNLCYTTFVRAEDYRPELEPHINWFYTTDKKGKKYKFPFYKSSFKKGLVPELMESFIKERKKIRAAQKLPENKHLFSIFEARQLAMKINANGFYGFINMSKGKYPCLPIGATICQIGQESTKRLARFMEENKFGKTVYGDTDSVMIKMVSKSPKDALELGEYCAKLINGLIKKGYLNLLDNTIHEEDVPALFADYEIPLLVDCERCVYGLFIKKKKYVCAEYNKDGERIRNDNGEYKLYRKGLFSKRNDSCKYTASIYDKCVLMCLDKKPLREIFTYLYDRLKDAYDGNVPVKDFCTSRKVGFKYSNDNAPVKVYKDRLYEDGIIVFPGERVPIIVVEYDGPLQNPSMGLKFRMPIEFERGNYKIDCRYYIENTMANSLDYTIISAYPEIETILGHIYFGKRLLNGDVKKTSLARPTLFFSEMIKNHQSIDSVMNKVDELTL